MRKETLYSLIPLDTFKAVMGIDDREDKIARFCLVTATHTIEQYCKRRLLRKKHTERIEYYGDLFLPMAEYPVISINSEQIRLRKIECALVIYESVRKVKSSNFYGFVKT